MSNLSIRMYLELPKALTNSSLSVPGGITHSYKPCGGFHKLCNYNANLLCAKICRISAAALSNFHLCKTFLLQSKHIFLLNLNVSSTTLFAFFYNLILEDFLGKGGGGLED